MLFKYEKHIVELIVIVDVKYNVRDEDGELRRLSPVVWCKSIPT